MAATTSTSVSTVCFHRPWLRMKSRPMNTPMASALRALQPPGERGDQQAQDDRRHEQQQVDQPVEEEVQPVGDGAEEGVEVVGQPVEEGLAPLADRNLDAGDPFRNRIHRSPSRPPGAIHENGGHLVEGRRLSFSPGSRRSASERSLDRSGRIAAVEGGDAVEPRRRPHPDWPSASRWRPCWRRRP